MSTMTTATEAKATQPATQQEKPRRERRSWTVRLDGGDGSELRVRAWRRGDGTARTEVVHSTRDGKKWKHSRGATQDHASVEAARKTQDQLVAAATAKGWRVREARGGGFERRPDAFDVAHIPAPTKTKK